jgi:signal transduction histidine kinase
MKISSWKEEVKAILFPIPKVLLTKKTFFWIFPLSIFLTLFLPSHEINSALEYAKWTLIGILGYISMVPFFIYGLEKKKQGIQVLLVLLMGTTRGFVILLLMPIFKIQTSQSLALLIAYSIIIIFYWFVAGSIINDFTSKFRDDIKKLIQILADRRVSDGLDTRGLNISSKVLLARISDLQSQVLDTLKRNPTPENITEQAHEIDLLVREHIRPLSHSEWRNGELVTLKVGFFSSLKAILMERKIPVLGLIFLTLPYAVMTGINNYGFIRTLALEFVWISILLNVRLLTFYVTERVKGSPWFWNLFFIISSSFLSTVITSIVLFNWAGNEYEFSEIFAQQASASLKFSITSCIATFAITLLEDERTVLKLIANNLSAKDIDELLESADYSEDRREYAQYLHAEVQSHLLACKLLLLKSAESDFKLLTTEVTRQVIERFESIKEPYVRTHVKKTTDRVEEIAQLWKGMSEIRYEIPVVFDSSEAPRDVIAQLIEESVVNAIRHGKANEIVISARMLGESFSVTIVNNGDWKDGKPSVGLGTILFNTFADDWSLTREGDKTVMNFLVLGDSQK